MTKSHNFIWCVKCKTTDGPFGAPYATTRGKKYYFCKPCGNKRKKDHYDSVKVIVFNHYGNNCACCGESNRLFLTIDHINNDGYLHREGSGQRFSGIRLYCYIKANNFPATYQVLCMNCNFGKRMNNGVCPHLAV